MFWCDFHKGDLVSCLQTTPTASVKSVFSEDSPYRLSDFLPLKTPTKFDSGWVNSEGIHYCVHRKLLDYNLDNWGQASNRELHILNKGHFDTTTGSRTLHNGREGLSYTIMRQEIIINYVFLLRFIQLKTALKVKSKDDFRVD